MIKGAFETAVHHRGGYQYMRIHEFEEGDLVVGGGVVISWVVVSSLFVEDNDVAVELQLGIGGVWGVLVRTVVSEAGLERGRRTIQTEQMRLSVLRLLLATTSHVEKDHDGNDRERNDGSTNSYCVHMQDQAQFQFEIELSGRTTDNSPGNRSSLSKLVVLLQRKTRQEGFAGIESR